jgi:IS30 family transposase
VSREVSRHGGRPQYRANEADHQAWESALRPKACLLAVHGNLQEIVAGKLILDWSPEQISGCLKMQYPRTRACACPTKPFTAAYSIQARGVLKKRGDSASTVQASHTPLAALSYPRAVPRSDRLGSAAATKTRTGCCASNFPKRTDLSGYSQSEFDKVAARLSM